MDIVLGVSMAPTTVRLVLVEGESADGVTIDGEEFQVDSAVQPSAAEQTLSAIMGTRESAIEGRYHLASTGVTWTDPVEATALRDALAAHKVENVMLVSSFLAAAALAQSAGSAAGYTRTGLLFLEPETVTLAVVDSADGAIVAVRREPMRSADTPVKMVAELSGRESPPDGLFVVGCGVDVTTVEPQLQTATLLPVSSPEEPELALARGAALASASAPLFTASTSALAYAQDPDLDWATAEVVEPYATIVGSADESGGAVAYSIGPIDDIDDGAFTAAAAGLQGDQDLTGRKAFLMALTVMTVFFVGVLALVISLAVSGPPAVSQRPASGAKLVLPVMQLPAPAPNAVVAPAPPQAVPSPAPAAAVAPAAPQVPAEAAPAPAPVRAATPKVLVPAAAAPRSAPAAEAPKAIAPVPAAAPVPAPVPAAPAPVPVAPLPPAAVPAPVPAAPAPTPLAPKRLPVPVPVLVPVAPRFPLLPVPILAPLAPSPFLPGGGSHPVTGGGIGGGYGGNPGYGGDYGGNPGSSGDYRGDPGFGGGYGGDHGGYGGGYRGNPGGFGGR